MGNSDESSVPFLADLENEYTGTEKSHISPLDNPRITKCSKKQTCFWISCMVVVTLLTNTATYLTTHQPLRNLDNVCAKHTSQTWSQLPKLCLLKSITRELTLTGPILDNIDIEYETVRFNGSLFTNTIYREEPSPEVDEAWHNLGTKCMLSVSISSKINFDADTKQ